MKDDQAYLEHILLAIEKAERYIAGLDKADFLKDEKTIDAVLRTIEIIGEAASRISEKLQEANPEIPWPEIVSMRNRLIHGYAEVDLDRVWDTCELDLPKLKAQIEALLAKK